MDSGTGSTGLEKLFEAAVVGWYLGSIAAIMTAVYTGDRVSVRVTLLCPLIYHVYLTYVGITTYLYLLFSSKRSPWKDNLGS